MHKVCRLNHKLFYTVCYCSLKSLLNVVDLLTISCIDVIYDDLCCESSSYAVIGIGSCKCLFNSSDILSSALVKACTKAYYQKLFFSDLITV